MGSFLRRRSGTGKSAIVGDSLTRSEIVWNEMAPTSSTVFVRRVTSANYQLMQQIGGGRYIQWNMDQPVSLPGDKTPIPHQIRTLFCVIPTLSIDDTNAAFVYSGTGWTIGGSNHRSSTTGDFYTWTTPAATWFGVTIVTGSNCGLGKVTVDGSSANANLCLTAQQVIDLGWYPNTILVTNGGTLDPTDRVIEHSNVTGNPGFQPIASNLSETAHTVVVTVTGYKRAASTDVRVLVTDGVYGSSTITPTTSSVTLTVDQKVNGGATSLNNIGRLLYTTDTGPVSAFEYAHNIYPAGFPLQNEWTGNLHGYEDQTSWIIAVDGVTQEDGGENTMSDGEVLSGTEIICTRTTRLYNPNVGAGLTVVGNVSTIYTFNSNGLKVDWSLTWAQSMGINSSYLTMYPIQAQFSGITQGGFSATGATNHNLTNDNDSYVGNNLSNIVWMWNPTAHYGVAVNVPAASSALGPNSSPDFTFIEDRSGVTGVNKVYFTRQSDNNATNESVINNDIWTSSMTYRVSWKPDAASVFG